MSFTSSRANITNNLFVLEPDTINNQTVRKQAEVAEITKPLIIRGFSCDVNRMVHFSNHTVEDLRALAV